MSRMFPMSEEVETKILIVEDEVATRRLLELACAKRGYAALSATSGKEALALISDSVSTIILNLGLPDMDGLKLLQELLKAAPWVPCFVITGRDSARTAVACLKAGARDFFVKPVELNPLFEEIRSAVQHRPPELRYPSESLASASRDPHWRSEAGVECHAQAMKAAALSTPLLISGKSATGRMAIARLVHASGVGRGGPLHILDVSEQENICLETVLFGSAGSVEGASARGLFHKCGGGTLIISNLEKMPLPLQAKFATALEKGRYQQKGSITSILLECRIICITSANLEEESAARRVSKKLWLILRNVHIRMPELKSRIEDVPIFVGGFLSKLCIAHNTPLPRVPVPAMNVLLQHHWPENLDELKLAIEIAYKNCDGHIIAASDLPGYLWNSAEMVEEFAPPVVGSSKIVEIERASLLAALTLSGGNRRLAAQRLGVSLRTIYNMIRRYQIASKKSRSRGKSPSSDSLSNEITE